MMSPFVIRRVMWSVFALVVAVLYAGTLDAPFVYDDKIEVIGNRTIRFLDEWEAIALYNVSRILLLFSYAINFDMWGMDPAGYHAVNIAIHALVIGAAIWLAESVATLANHSAPLLTAGLGVGLWSIHPMCTEAVTYITGRSESLCALFCILSLAGWAQGLLRDGHAATLGRLFGFFAFVCAVLTKEVGAMIPAAAFALELFLGASGSWKTRLKSIRWRWYLPFIVLIAVAVAARLSRLGHLLPNEVSRPVAAQLTTQTEVWLRYVLLWFMPVGQTIYHHLPDVSPTSLRGFGSIVGFFAALGTVFWWCRTRPLVAWSLLTGALFLLPSSSIVQLKEHMAEHRAYSFGLFLIMSLMWSIPTPVLHRAKKFVVILVIPLMIGTIIRNHVWGSEVRIWHEATVHNPQEAEAWYGYGDALRFDDQYDNALAAYEQCVELDPDYLDGWNNLGISLAETGKTDEARQAWKRALRQSPSYCKAHNNLGQLAALQQSWERAINEFTTSLLYCPSSIPAHYGLGNIFYGPRRDRSKAAHHYSAVIELDPHFINIEEVQERLLELTW